MMGDAWQVFLDGLDPVRLERERFPAHEVVQRESFYLDEHHQQMMLHEQDKQDHYRLRGMERLDAALADIERAALEQSRRARAEQAWRERLAERRRQSTNYLRKKEVA